MDAKTQKLFEIMRDYKLKAADVAEILEKEPNTIRVWRCKSSTRIIPQAELDCLIEGAPAYAQRRAEEFAEKARAATLAKWSKVGAKAVE